jgi:UDP-2,4-diacetamido-2,4,6-trideoxy-beta-L-altropyranose hydrolase
MDGLVTRAKKQVAIRVDASGEIGTGHFMRCLALADGLKARGARVRFLSRHAPSHLREMATGRGHELALLDGRAEPDAADRLAHSAWLGTGLRADARDAAQALSGETWDWIVVDHYALDARWESALRGAARRILAIDDIADRTHDCDLLLDQNIHPDAERRYAGRTPEHCRRLLGPRYALLREEFARLRAGTAARDGRVRRVLVFFGGVDAGGHTRVAIEALAGLGGRKLQIDVVVGAQNAHRREIETRCAALGFACHVQTARMSELMSAADLALGAGGSASWERCCLGLPTLTLAVADNQKELVEDAALAGLLCAPALDQAPLADHLRGLLDNPLLLRAMSLNGMQAVDGRGAGRVLRAMGVGALSVRRAAGSDSAKVYAWRNDPAIRAVSRNPDFVERGAHDAWFAAALASHDRLLLIGERDGEEIGVVRFDVRERAAEVSIYLAPQLGGSGNGVELLLAAETWLAQNRPEVAALEAEVLLDNRRSHGLFLAGGYRLDSSRYVKRLG